MTMFAGGLEQLKAYSPQDYDRIKMDLRIEPAKLAFNILTERRELLEWKAQRLADEFRPRVMRALSRDDPGMDEAEM